MDKVYFRDEFGEPVGTDKMKNNYDYLLVPIKFGYAFGNGFKIIPKIGITPSLLLNAKVVFPAFDENGPTGGTEELDIKENIRKFDLSGQLELEASYPILYNFEIVSSVLYRHSITEFSNRDFFENSHMRHYGFSFSVGFKYSIK